MDDAAAIETDRRPGEGGLLELTVLLRSFALGQPLQAGEVAEIERLLPPPAPRLVGGVTRQTYRHALIHYARQLGWKSDRTLKRWVEKGREASPPDLPPFDEPECLAHWWARVMKHRVPPRLLQLAGGASGQPASKSKGPSAAAGVEPPPQELPPRELPSGSGFEASLNRARDNEREAAADLAQARRGKDQGRVEMCQRAWERAFDSLRKAEKDAESVMLSSGELVKWSDVEREQAECLLVLNQSLRSMMTRLATRVPMPPDLFHKLGRAYQDELDRAFGQLSDSGYAPQFSLAA